MLNKKLLLSQFTHRLVSEQLAYSEMHVLLQVKEFQFPSKTVLDGLFIERNMYACGSIYAHTHKMSIIYLRTGVIC